MDRSTKQQINDLLMQRDYDRLLDLCEEHKLLWKVLRSSLYDTDENLCWPAIEAIARLMQRWWQAGQEERVREYIRSLFWSLNDESGGIGWNAPQTIAETIVLIPELIDPYGSMMVDRSLGEPLLVNSGLWGMGRLGKRLRQTVEFFEDTVIEQFKSSESQTLGLAAWAMGEVGFSSAKSHLEVLKNRPEPVRIYLNGEFSEKSLGQWVEEAISKIDHSSSIE